MPFSLERYRERLELPPSSNNNGGNETAPATAGSPTPTATLSLLTTIMEAQSRLISFENMSVVLNQPIDISPNAVAEKLLSSKRGGYCFELNVLLHSALTASGYTVRRVLTRVRWGRTVEEVAPFTHVVLFVDGADFTDYLVDCGFGCRNCPAPIALGRDGEEQIRVDGVYRTSTGADGGTTTLEIRDRDDPDVFRPLYAWRAVRWETEPDFVVANWYSCTYPKARFTQQFFVAKIANGEKHHVLNDEYLRRCLTSGKVLERRKVEGLGALLDLVRGTFGLEIESDERLGRFL